VKGNYSTMLKQIQKMREEIAKIQEELAKERLEVSAGGGMVTAVVNGQQEILGIRINPAAVDPNDVEILEEMILAAVNQALRQSRDLATEKMSRLTGGLSIPGLF